MRRTIETGGKFYTEEIRIVGEVNLQQLEDQLADVRAQKEATLAKKAAGYDGVVVARGRLARALGGSR